MCGKNLWGMAVLIAVLMSFFAACKTDDGTPPPPVPKQFKYPTRYQVVPGWTDQTQNIITVAGIDPSTPAGNLAVMYAERKGKNNWYIIYLGRIDNVPIGNPDTATSYNGITPVTISLAQGAINSTAVSTSVSTAINETTVSKTVNAGLTIFTMNAHVGFSWFGVNVGVQSAVQNSIAKSTTKELSIESTETTAVAKSESTTHTVSYTIGNKGEPVGRYRIMLFASADVYLSVQLNEDNSALITDPEISVCARAASYNYQLDFDPNTTGDFVRTGGGGMLPDPNDFDFTTLPLPANKFRFVAVGGAGKMAYSDNGIDWQESASIKNWTSGTIDDTSRNWNGVAYSNGTFIAVGNVSGSSPSSNMARSDDGINWQLFSTTNADWNSVTYANGIFVATGLVGASGGIMAWFPDIYNNWQTHYMTVPRGGAYGDGKWVVVGASNSAAYANNLPSFTNNTVGTGTSATWNSVAYGTGKFVAVGDAGRIAYSGTGNWTSKTVGTNAWNRVIYGNDLFVTVGSLIPPAGPDSSGRIAWSLNGIDWTEIAVTGRSDFRDITYCEELDLWVAVGGAGNGIIVYSNDGKTWSEVAPAVAGGGPWNGVTYGEFFEEE